MTTLCEDIFGLASVQLRTIFKYRFAPEGVKKKVKFENSIIAVDGIYLNIRPVTKKDGGVAQNYGNLWINIYFPESTIKCIVDKFKEDTAPTIMCCT